MRTLLLIALLAACSKTNPNYCPGNPDDNCLIDADINTPQGCMTAAECTNSAKPICEPTQKVCVECTADMIGACGGTTPVCSTTNTCVACTAHDQCDSNVCLPDGSCAMESQVAYVAATGDDGTQCTSDAPCQKITSAALKGKPYIKVMTDLDEAVVLNNANVTIVAEPGVAVKRSTTGPVFDLKGTSTITIRDLTIREGLGSTGHGLAVNPGEPVALTLDGVFVLNNAGYGVIAQGGSLTMTRCVLSGNSSGGGSISNTFNITNSLIVSNGSATSQFGGLFLTPSGSVSLKFNTVANNTAMASAITGINCTLAVTATNTIVSGNDTSASCTFEYSLFDTGVNVSGTNRAGDPKFRNVNPSNPRASDYFRIQSASDAVDQADPKSTMMTDIDGDARPQGSAPDIGADETL